MKRNSYFFLRKIGDTYYLQDTNDRTRKESRMVFLNETAAFLWEKMEDCNTAETLVNALMTEYDVQEDMATDDVLSFLNFLSENGCLEIEESF